MAETLDKELDNMEQVDEGSDPITKNAKPAMPMDSSKAGSAKKVVCLLYTSPSPRDP